MSVVALVRDSLSSVDVKDLLKIAESLRISISDQKDVEEYLLLLKSFEAVLRHVDNATDYIHPALLPCPTLQPRTFWRPRQDENPLNAWSHQCYVRSSSPTSNLLNGRTIVIKDNICVAGLPTTLGTSPDILSKDGKHPISPIDATIVSRLLTAGAVIKGTSTCENFCASPLSFSADTGPVHNPLHWGYTTGGSSSGSCALVACDRMHKTGDKTYERMETAELAVGSDQAGSVRNPAAFCGLYGLKPTHGLIPYTGAASMSPMIDHLGPIATTLEDTALLLKVMAGYDGLDARMTPESPLIGAVKDYPALQEYFRKTASSSESSTEATNTMIESNPPMKIGILTESFFAANVAPEVRDGVLRAVHEYFPAAGAVVTEVSIPLHLEGPIIWTAATRPSMSQWLYQGKASGYLSHLPPHIGTSWPLTQEAYGALNSKNPAAVNILINGQFTKDNFAAVEAKAHRKVFELRAAYDQALEEVDVLVTPTAPSVAMPHPKLVDEHGRQSKIMEKLSVMIGVTNNTCPFNVTGHPALSVPAGSAPAHDRPDVQLPFAMQIIARRWKDEDTLKAATLFEAGRSRTVRL